VSMEACAREHRSAFAVRRVRGCGSLLVSRLLFSHHQTLATSRVNVTYRNQQARIRTGTQIDEHQRDGRASTHEGKSMADVPAGVLLMFARLVRGIPMEAAL
jgi:hypothetical protein